MDKLISIEGLDTYNGPSTRESPAYPRILQAFENTRMIAESVGAKVGDCLRLVMQDASHIYVGLKQSVANDFVQLHNGTCTGSINEAQKAIWGEVLFPSRPHAIIEVSRLNQDDIVEVESTFAVPNQMSLR
ncbi:hypothetical protein TMatcc_003889 [Talaromyces marneffei ATCC 18224]